MNTSLLDECIKSFQRVRGSMVEAMINLSAVFAAKEWESKYNSWGEFVEDGLQISESTASKMLKVNESYLLSGLVKPRELEGVDLEKLYLARSLEGSAKERIEKARVLTRDELKQETKDEVAPHAHQWIEICAVCKIKH